MDKTAREDFLFYVVGPALGLPLVFLPLMWIRAPDELGPSWPVAPIVGVVVTWVGILAYLASRRLIRFGRWRDLY